MQPRAGGGGDLQSVLAPWATELSQLPIESIVGLGDGGSGMGFGLVSSFKLAIQHMNIQVRPSPSVQAAPEHPPPHTEGGLCSCRQRGRRTLVVMLPIPCMSYPLQILVDSVLTPPDACCTDRGV